MGVATFVSYQRYLFVRDQLIAFSQRIYIGVYGEGKVGVLETDLLVS